MQLKFRTATLLICIWLFVLPVSGVKAATVSNPEAFITSLYQNLLGREPDAGGLAWWTEQVSSGAITPEHAILSMAASPESQATGVGSVMDVAIVTQWYNPLDDLGVVVDNNTSTIGKKVVDEVFYALNNNYDVAVSFNQTGFSTSCTNGGAACGGTGCVSDPPPPVCNTCDCPGYPACYVPPPAPVCTASCSTCSVDCDGGTQICTRTNCSTYSQSCNTQACVYPPTATLSASPSTIDSGQSSTLTWSSSETYSCVAAGGFSTGNATSGNVSVSPSTTSTYQITCSGPGGYTHSQATVTVNQPEASISANPVRVQKGTNSTITWSSSDVQSCIVSGPSLSTTGGTGSRAISISSQSVYTITCQTLTSEISDSVIVNVVPAFQEF